MKAKMKKVGIVTLITLIVWLCATFLCFAYLFLVPNSSLFGVKYISNKSAKYYQLGEYSTAINTIEIKTNKYSVDVLVDKDIEQIQVYQKNDLAGLVLKKKYKTGLKYEYDTVKNKLTIQTEETTGWVGFGASHIEVMLPDVCVNENTNLIVSAGKKSDVEIDGAEKQINSLSVSVYRGDVAVDNVKIKNLKLNANNSNIAFGEKLGSVINTVKLDIGNSTVNFLKCGGGETEISKVKKEEREINVANVSFNIEKLEIGGMSKDGLVKLIKCNEIGSTGYPDNRISGGKIECVYVRDTVQVASKDCSVAVRDVDGMCNFSSNGYGGLKISGKANAVVNANSSQGDIYVNRLNADGCNFSTNSGSITIKNATQSMQIISTSGDVDVKFAEDVGECGSGSNYRSISNLRVKNGSVKIEGLNYIKLEVDNGGKADIKLKYKRVLGKNEINLKSAKLTTIVPKNEGVTVNATCKNTALLFHVGTIESHNGEKFTGQYIETVYSGTPETNPTLKLNCDGGSATLISDDLIGEFGINF